MVDHEQVGRLAAGLLNEPDPAKRADLYSRGVGMLGSRRAWLAVCAPRRCRMKSMLRSLWSARASCRSVTRSRRDLHSARPPTPWPEPTPVAGSRVRGGRGRNGARNRAAPGRSIRHHRRGVAPSGRPSSSAAWTRTQRRLSPPTTDERRPTRNRARRWRRVEGCSCGRATNTPTGALRPHPAGRVPMSSLISPCTS